MTFYSTLAAGQIGYIAGDCDARIAVLDGAQELARWQPVRPAPYAPRPPAPPTIRIPPPSVTSPCIRSPGRASEYA